MRLLKYTILILIFWGLPTYTLTYVSPAIGSLTSFLTIALMILYYALLEQKGKPLLPFLLLGILYYTIAGLNYDGPIVDDKYFFHDFIKFLILIICGGELVKNTTIKELYIILFFGALSIICHAVFFPQVDIRFGSSYGRFSGFYINPNSASVICMIGFALSYGIKNNKIKLIGQLVFTLAGILTLSRTFIIVWLLMNIISLIISKKNILGPLIGAGVLIFVLLFSSIELNTTRFGALQSIFSSEQRIKTNVITEDSRSSTWALYTDVILNKPFFGNGYKKLKGGYLGLDTGVHNTYLMVIGEAGFIPFSILIWIIGLLLLKGFRVYKSELHYFLLAIVIALFLLASHMYFYIYFYVCISMFVYTKLNNNIIENNT